jgi:hypothetical protein
MADGKKKHQGTTVLRDNPAVDPVKVWREGYQSPPTLAEQLAEPEAQEIPVPGHEETHQYGEDGPDDEELEPGDPEPDPLTAPKVTELLADPPPEEGGVIPLEVVPGPGVAEMIQLQQRMFPPAPAADPANLREVCTSGHESPWGAKFCQECGIPFQVTAADWTCQNGHLIDASAKFCQECGDARPDLRAPVAGAGVAAELSARVTPESMLSPEEKAARAAQHAAALRMGAENPNVVFQSGNPGRPGVWLHVRKSGWTVFGVVWMRAQNIYLEEGTPRWAEAQDWIHLDEAAQTARWGRECFRLGKWPGKQSYADITEADYQRIGGSNVPTPEQLAAADRAEAARAGGVPPPMYAGGSMAGFRP